MKKNYTEPMLLLETVDAVDVIRTSGENGDCYLSDIFE